MDDVELDMLAKRLGARPHQVPHVAHDRDGEPDLGRDLRQEADQVAHVPAVVDEQVEVASRPVTEVRSSQGHPSPEVAGHSGLAGSHQPEQRL